MAFMVPDADQPRDVRQGSLRSMALLAAMAIALTTGLGARADHAVSQRATEANLRLALTLTYCTQVQARERSEHRPASLRAGCRIAPMDVLLIADRPPSALSHGLAFDLAQSCPWLTNLPPPKHARA